MSKEAMKLALEALETERDNYQDWDKEDGAPEYIHEAITALREALAEQPAPVQQAAYTMYDGKGRVIVHFDAKEAPAQQDSGLTNRYTTPQPAQRKPLTDEWRPSETGPQDGTPCLVYWGQSFGVPLIGVARRIYPYRGEMLWHGHGGSHNEVTHWMPLPDAPIEAAHGIKENT